MSISAQSYDNLWKEFDDNIENLLPESAQKTLDKIEKQAKKDKNDIQLLKTVIKRCLIISMNNDSPNDTIVEICNSYLPKLSKASQAILNVEIANKNSSYDKLLNYKDEDFIKTISMENYTDIFEKDDNQTVFDIELEPTLYDYIMHCLINIYRHFEVEKELYDKLLAFDLENNYLKAYYNNRINQLGFISNNETFDKYTALASECTDNEYVAKIKIKQIEYLTHVNVDKIVVENALVKAKSLCDETMELLDKNHPLYKQCDEYNKSLTRKTVNIQMPKVCVPGQPIPVGLSYRNTTSPTFRIFKVSSKEFKKLKRLEDKVLFDTLVAKKAVAESAVIIPEEFDYEEHSSLIALPALQNGQYYIAFSSNDSFDNFEDVVMAAFQVSELSYFTLETENCLNVYVVNRETGKPISGVTANIYKREYNYKTKNYLYKQLGESVSDKNGHFVLSEQPNSLFSIDLYSKNDTLVSNTVEDYYFNKSKDNLKISSEIYTDRAIYRPGQIVQFKGIAMRKTSIQKELLDDYDLVVNFRDANYQVIDTLEVKTNEYGAFSGSFIIPEDRIRGSYTININYIGSVSFLVEDYKRPTFEVTFDDPDKEYKIGDTISISGKIAALSGFGLDNIKFKYFITRKASFPFRYWDWKPYYVKDEIIKTGENVTSHDGSFNVDFQLSPSSSINVANTPKYTYEIKIEATNKQGETQNGKFSVDATYNKYVITVDTDNYPSLENPSLEINDFQNLTVNVSNISGKPANTQVECKVFKIENIDKYPFDLGNFDRQLLSDQLLKAYFPHFDYYSKDSIAKNIVYQGVINANNKAKLLPDDIKLTPAKYIVELRSIDDTLSAFSEKYIVYDTKSKKMPYKSMCWTRTNMDSAHPGETINYFVGSSENNVSALVMVKLGKKILKSERITLNNNIYKFSYKVREEDRGRLDFQVVFTKYNTETHQINYVDVPFDNLDLDITINTERYKMLPGSEESWSVTVKDYKGKPAETSMLAVMYDAALDNFAKLNWNLDTKPSISNNIIIKSDKSFEKQVKYKHYDTPRFYLEYNLMFSDLNLLYNYSYKFNNDADIYYCFESRGLDDFKKTGSNENAVKTKFNSIDNPPAKIRKDFNETAFFYPDLRTDENGNCTLNFTMPDALTRWNLMFLAYSKDMKAGKLDKTCVTQQPLMIMADMPRFAYDEDTLWLVANVINSTFCAIKPIVKLEVFNEYAQKVELILSDQIIEMDSIPAGQSRSVRWKVAMHKDINLLTCRFSATTDGFSDAEQHEMPVLSTDIYLTQTYALTVNANSIKEYEFNFNNDDEKNHNIRLDFKGNPVFYVAQALPYLAENDDKYSTAAFNRYFVNKMAKQIIENNPSIVEMLKEHEHDTLSELQKNEDIKSILLKETPWVLDAQNESQQRANISKLFDTEAINKNIESALKVLEDKQKYNGGWSWIDGMPESEFITQYILCGLGRLGTDNNIAEKAFHFIENEVIEQYERLDTQKKKKNAICDYTTMKELLGMSYFNYKTSKKFDEAKTFFIDKLHTDWRRYIPAEQAHIALILNRNGYIEKAHLIVKSLRERAKKNEFEMYWNNIDVQGEARILEAFNEIEPVDSEIDAMRFWILSNKRTNMWENDRATVEAIFAIMERGSDWTSEDAQSSIITDNGKVKVVITNLSNHVVWGGLYRQYFVPIDKVQKHNDEMKVKHELFKEKIVDNQVIYSPIKDENIKIGDKIKIVISFENSQDMEFVYLKDLRGACFEPTEQLSGYHSSNGMWYFQSTTDVSMDFFFEKLYKGKHELSHTVYVTKEGSFSTGYSHIQCQYAPEFGAYSNGERINVNP